MRPPEFRRLARNLEAIGVAPSVIRRTVQELQDHFEDAEAAARADGLDDKAAFRAAVRTLGRLDAIAAEIAARPNLLSWRHRWPQTARCVDSMSYCLLWPVSPFVYYANHPAGIVRWGLSSSLAACVTATMLLVLHWILRSGGMF